MLMMSQLVGRSWCYHRECTAGRVKSPAFCSAVQWSLDNHLVPIEAENPAQQQAGAIDMLHFTTAHQNITLLPLPLVTVVNAPHYSHLPAARRGWCHYNSQALDAFD